MGEEFSTKAHQVIAHAQEAASQHGGECIEPIHLLLGVLTVAESGDTRVPQMLALKGISLMEVQYCAEAAVPRGERATKEPEFSKTAKQVLKLAQSSVRHTEAERVEPEHILIALARVRRGLHFETVIKPLGFESSAWTYYLKAANTPAIPAGHPLATASADAERLLDAAERQMRTTFCGRIGTGHLMLAVLDSTNYCNWLQGLDVDPAQLRQRLRNAILADKEIATAERRFTPAAKQALEGARDIAATRGLKQWDADHVLIALLTARSSLRERLRLGTPPDDPVHAVIPPEQIMVLLSALRPLPEKEYRLRSMGLGALVMLVVCCIRLAGSPDIAQVLGAGIIFFAFVIFLFTLAASVRNRSAQWHEHAFSFALGIIISFPFIMALIGVTEMALHPAPFVKPTPEPLPEWYNKIK